MILLLQTIAISLPYLWSWPWSFWTAAAVLNWELVIELLSCLAPSRTLKIPWCGWTRWDTPCARVLWFMNTPARLTRQSSGGHRRVSSHFPRWFSFSGEEQVSPPFYADGKTELRKGHMIHPRSSLDLDPCTCFTMQCDTCRSQWLCLGREFWFIKPVGSKLLASWRFSRKLK